jgi:Polysaccharide biosynthesis/export protein
MATRGEMSGPRAGVPGKLLAAILVTALLVGGLALGAVAQEQQYRIGVKDVLKVTVWGHKDLSKSVTVAAGGTIPFPLVGDVPAAGLTPAQLEGRLEELLGKHYLLPVTSGGRSMRAGAPSSSPRAGPRSSARWPTPTRASGTGRRWRAP